MGSLDPTAALPPFPQLKSFALTHILYDPAHPLSIPFTLLSLTPIFLFVSYFTLLIFDRRITILALAAGSIFNEILSLGLKKVLKGERPYLGYGEVGDGYGMPSSHSQAAGFLVAWGVGYWLTLERRRANLQRSKISEGSKVVGQVRRCIYLIGLFTWSVLVAYSRWHLMYHSIPQVVAGYLAGLIFGTTYFIITEYIPLFYPASLLGQMRRGIESLWVGIGGIGGWELSTSGGGWGEGWVIVGDLGSANTKIGKAT